MSEEITLSLKHQAFLDAYLLTHNQTKAAIAAGYSERSARQTGSELMTNPNIKAALRARYEANAMSANELLHHLAEIARGNIDDVIDDKGNLDLQRARELGKSPLIKSVRSKTTLFTDKSGDGSETFESEVGMYDRMKALELIGKHLAMFTDKVENVTPETKMIDAIKARQFDYPTVLSIVDGDTSKAADLFRMAGVPIDAITVDVERP